MGKKKHVNRVNTRKSSSSIASSIVSSLSPSSKKSSKSAESEGANIIEGTPDVQQQQVPKGLPNIGNTCFFNSILQSLLTIHHFTRVSQYDENKVMSKVGDDQKVTGIVGNAVESIGDKAESADEIAITIGEANNAVDVEDAHAKSKTKGKTKGKSKKAKDTIEDSTEDNVNDNEGALTSVLKFNWLPLYASSKATISPSTIFNIIVKHYPQFKGRRQQDAHELFVCLLGQLEDERKLITLENNQQNDSFCNCFLSPFEGKIVSIQQCHSCRNRFAKLDPFCNISLSIPGSSHLNTLPDSILKRLSKAVKSIGSKKKTSKNTFAALDELEEAGTQSQSSSSSLAVIESPVEPVSASSDTPGQSEVQSNEVPVQNSYEIVKEPICETPSGEVIESLSEGVANIALEGIVSGVEDRGEVNAVTGDDHHDNSASGPSNSSTDNDSSQTHSGQDLAAEIIEPPAIDTSRCTSAGATLYDCLDSFVATETLLASENNGYRCEHCLRVANSSSTNAQKRMLLYELPQVLVLHLKRLLPGGKYNAAVPFPLELDVRPYLSVNSSSLHSQGTADEASCTEGQAFQAATNNSVTEDEDITLAVRSTPLEETSASPESREEEDDTTSARDTQAHLERPAGLYQLQAVVVHSGGASGGHYIAYVRRQHIWYYTSDSVVKKCDVSEVLKCQAYMLFYCALK